MLESPPAKPPAEPEIVFEGENDNVGIDYRVTIPAVVIILFVVLWGLVNPTGFSEFSKSTLAVVINNFGWAFVLCTTVFLGFAIVVAFSRFGQIRLGRNDEAPEFSTFSWIAMMFTAGMGIGLMFYGVAEPLSHYRVGIPGKEAGNVGDAMSSTLLHWTLHPWAVYGIVGLAIAYSTFRLGRRQLLSSAFTPLLGERGAKGWLGRIIDIMAIIATIFGTACSLGIGATQISAGLNAANIVKNPSMSTIVVIVSILTLAYLISAMSGVGNGIRYVSNANMVLAAILAIIVFVLGPTVTILNLLLKLSALTYPISSKWLGAPPNPPAITPAHGSAAGPSSTGRGGSPGAPSSACSWPAFPAAAPSVNSSSA